jgi:hypothetical protein
VFGPTDANALQYVRSLLDSEVLLFQSRVRFTFGPDKGNLSSEARLTFPALDALREGCEVDVVAVPVGASVAARRAHGTLLPSPRVQAQESSHD